MHSTKNYLMLVCILRCKKKKKSFGSCSFQYASPNDQTFCINLQQTKIFIGDENAVPSHLSQEILNILAFVTFFFIETSKLSC